MVSLDSTSEGGMQEMTTNPQQSSDQRARFNELCRWILKVVPDDPILRRLATLLINIPDLKLKEIAKQLGLSETEAHNAKRRLSRRLKKIA
jgi:DNA-directed RNA polymerase specialized sigma24 family protein